MVENGGMEFARGVAATVLLSAILVDTVAPEIGVRGRKTIEMLRERVVIHRNGAFKVVLEIKTGGWVSAKLRAVDNVGLKSKRAEFRILQR